MHAQGPQCTPRALSARPGPPVHAQAPQCTPRAPSAHPGPPMHPRAPTFPQGASALFGLMLARQNVLEQGLQAHPGRLPKPPCRFPGKHKEAFRGSSQTGRPPAPCPLRDPGRGPRRVENPRSPLIAHTTPPPSTSRFPCLNVPTRVPSLPLGPGKESDTSPEGKRSGSLF